MRAGTWILVMLFAAAAASAAQLYRALSAERERASVLEARVAEFERQRSLLPAPAALPPAPAPAVPSPARPSPAAVTPALAEQARAALPTRPTASSPYRDFQWSTAPQNAPDAAELRRARERQAALWMDPEYRAAMLEQRKLSIGRRYDELARELGLSPHDRDRLLTTLAEHQLPHPDHLPPWGGGPPPDETAEREWRERAEARERTQQDDLRALLGDAGYSRYREYQQTLGARIQARQIGESLAANGTPLREEQERALVKIYADEQRRLMDEFRRMAQAAPPPSTQVPGAPPPVRISSGTSPANAGAMAGSPAVPASAEERRRWRERHLAAQEASVKRVREAASAVLSPDQLERVMQQQEANLAMQRATMRLEP